MRKELQWLRNTLLGLNMQGMIVSNPKNIEYLTGIKAEGILLITRKENIYITDARYTEYVHSVLTIEDEVVVYDIREISIYDYENFFTFCENVGFEEHYVTYAKYKEFMHKYKINNLCETENLIEKQRMIKTSEEIDKIKKACEITDRCYEHILNYIKPGHSEIDISNEIQAYFQKQGITELAFETIVASGENTSKPHAIPTHRKIKENDIVLIDFGCKYKGYCSDMTRTFFIGNINDEQRKVYDLVLKNQIQTESVLRDGANAKIIAKSVENDFALNDFMLVHSLGHGLGLDVHEAPNMNFKTDCILKENMVVTNEPGIYIPGKFGVRIEDTVWINKGACTRLTESNREIICVNNFRSY